MTRTVSGLLLAMVVTLATALVPSPVTALPTQESTVSARDGVTLRPALRRVLHKVNAARARHDLRPLRVRPCLVHEFAQPWARHLADTGQLVHQDLQPILKKCSGLTRAGENIASGFTSAGAVMRAWMASPGHRRNILRRGYRVIGLGLAVSEDGTRYWVQDFGG